MSKEQITRDQINQKDKWRLEDIFVSDENWEIEFKRIKNEIPTLAKLKGSLTSGKNLLSAISQMHKVEEAIGKLYSYAHMRNDEDKSVAKHQEQYDRMGGLLIEYNQAVSFFEPELLELEDSKLESFKNENGMEIYTHFLNNMTRVKPHILSEKEENLMALAGEVRRAPADIFSMFDNADIKFPIIKDKNEKDIRLTNALYGKYQQSPNRRLRKDSYIGLHKPYLDTRNTLAASYSAIVKSHIFNTRARNYKSTLNAALDANNVPVEVYHTLIDTAKKNLGPLQRFLALRKKVLKLDDVYDYDLRAPLFSSTQKEYSWQQACDMVVEGAKELGGDYVKNLKKGFNEGWIDVYENKGKRSGAYSSGTYGVHPYVLMNYNGTLNDIYTLTHEMGHALHTWYTINNQPFVYGDYPIFLAEVASTTNEALLEKYLIDKAQSKEEKLGLLNAALEKYNGTFYRQAIFAEFELKSHEAVENGEALTADKLDEMFGQIYKSYYGDDFTLLPETKALWSRIPHFYYNYYVFQYSTSFVASSALVSKILQDGEPARDQYLNFLKSGRSKYPMQTLLDAGVDMSSADPVLRTIGLMDELLNQVENLAG
ncbi:MAG: oligoendopeptidase F [Calditrichaeota bacterium]|nr:oligoendopeptidase F [Calditrichota bacterium]